MLLFINVLVKLQKLNSTSTNKSLGYLHNPDSLGNMSEMSFMPFYAHHASLDG